MIRIDVPQGSKEWRAARIGIPTASNFSRLITAKTLKPSAQAAGYLHELIAEWCLGVPVNDASSGFMERGTDLEDAAVRLYEFQRDVETQVVGFCLRDDRSAGCSPDRLVGDDGGLEIKCPSAKVHVGYMLDGPGDDYRAQVQGALWVTGRKWWDFLSYHPQLPPVLVRYEPEPEFIGALAEAVAMFLEKIATAKDRMRALGCSPEALADATAKESAEWLDRTFGAVPSPVGPIETRVDPLVEGLF